MNKRIENITLLNVLGKGSFGTVYLSKKDGKNGYFATKQIERTMADKPSFHKYFENELRILHGLNHPNIVHLEDLKVDNKNYYIVMEYINGGSLTDCLGKYRKKYGKAFPEEIVQYLMRQIVDAIKYIHNKKIIHRDLKLDNIMVSFNNEVDKNTMNMMRAVIKKIDFGFAIQLTQNNLASSVLGSPINMDPAILKEMASRGKKINQLGYDQKADIWSLGTICYELLIGQSVFNAETMNDLIRKVEAGKYVVPTTVSAEMVSFLNGMLQYRGEKRLSSDELSEHPFLKKNIRDFTKIDTTKVKKKIDNKGLNINIKRNKTIWGIYNENIEEKLLGIGGRNYGAPSPLENIPEYNVHQRRKTDTDIPRIPHNTPLAVNKNFNRANTNAYPPYMGQNNGIYAQNMIPNQPPYMPGYPNFSQPLMSPPYPPPYPGQNQPQSYSSGTGGYDFPTFEPSPYTFASNIYGLNSPPSQNQQGYTANFMNTPPPSRPPIRPIYGYSPMNNDEGYSSEGCSIF